MALILYLQLKVLVDVETLGEGLSWRIQSSRA